MAQAARMVISLEFELVAEVLPEGDRAAQLCVSMRIVRLDEDTVDAFSLPLLWPMLVEMGAQGRGYDRRQRLFSLGGVMLDLANQLGLASTR
jgi:hypothetical protein